eukprot:6185617-Pleurochrysis_carterae.AAC.2
MRTRMTPCGRLLFTQALQIPGEYINAGSSSIAAEIKPSVDDESVPGRARRSASSRDRALPRSGALSHACAAPRSCAVPRVRCATLALRGPVSVLDRFAGAAAAR